MYKSYFSRFIFIVLTLSMIFTGCATKAENTSAGSEAKFREVGRINPPQQVSCERPPLNEKEILDMSDLIVKGSIIGSKEFVVEESIGEGYINKYYKTVYDFKIEDVYYSKDKGGIKSGDTIKVMSSFSTHNWEAEAIDLKKGQKCILFTSIVEDAPAVKFTDLAKYCIKDPWRTVVLIDNDAYGFDEAFSSLSPNSSIKERKINDSYSLKMRERSDAKFIDDLNELISKAKIKSEGK